MEISEKTLMGTIPLRLFPDELHLLYRKLNTPKSSQAKVAPAPSWKTISWPSVCKAEFEDVTLY